MFVIIVTCYLIFTTLYAKYLYKKYFYAFNPFIEDKKNLHDIYNEFSRTDKSQFTEMRLIIGLPFGLFRVLIFFTIVFIFAIILRVLAIGYNFEKTQKNFITIMKNKIKKLLIRYVPKFALLFCFFIVEENSEFSNHDKLIYEKYLGKDYRFPKKHSIIISNHISWAEIILNVDQGCAYLVSEAIGNIPLIGYIVKFCGGLFMNRRSKESRELIKETIKERQLESLNEIKETSLFVYPEGTITNGKYLIEFKKGAFNSLLPVKPILILPYYENNIEIGQGVINPIEHIIIMSCFLKNKIRRKFLPIIEYNDFCKKNNKKFDNEDDSTTFMNTCYNIMLEIGKFKPTKRGLRDAQEYTKRLFKV